MGKPEGGIRLTHSDASPIEVDLDLASFEGMGWIRRHLRDQSGWMQVAVSSMDTYWGRWSTRLIVAVTDKGELLGRTVAESLMQMRGLDLRQPQDVPDETLDGHLEMAHWDFLGRCDIRHLAMLDEAEAELAAAILAEQDRGEAVLAEVEGYLAQLNRQRRKTNDADTRDAISERIALLESKHAAAAAWLVRRLASLREAGEQEQADMLDMLQNHGHLHVMQTVRWVAHHPADRPNTIDEHNFLVRGPRQPTDNPYAERLLARLRLRDDEDDDQRQARRERERELRLERWNNRPLVKTDQEREYERREGLKVLREAWLKASRAKSVKARGNALSAKSAPPGAPQPMPDGGSDLGTARQRILANANHLRTKAQEVSAKRRAVQQQREREVAEVLDRYPTLDALERALDITPSTGIENRRRARVLREAIARLSPRSVVVAQRMQPSPLAKAMPTPLPEPVAPSADDSIAIDALIDQTLRDMLKNL